MSENKFDLKNALEYLPEGGHIHVTDNDGTVWRIEKKADPEPENPCEWESNLGTLTCWHRRYALGNEQPKDDPQNWLAMFFKNAFSEPGKAKAVYDFLKTNPHGTHISVKNNPEAKTQSWTLFYGSMVDDPNDVFTVIVTDPENLDTVPRDFFDACCDEMYTQERITILNQSGYLFMPLYLMDHSGLSISTEDFYDRWDSGQIGWIHTDAKRAEELWEADWDVDRARQELKDQVIQYDKYLQGEYYGIVVSKFEPWDHDDPETADESEFVEQESCWGYSDAESMADFVNEVIGSCREYEYKAPAENQEPVYPDWSCVFCQGRVKGRLVGPKQKFYGTCENCGAVYHQ